MTPSPQHRLVSRSFLRLSGVLACGSAFSLAACARSESPTATKTTPASLTLEAEALSESSQTPAKPRSFSWRAGDLGSADLATLVSAVNTKSGLSLGASDFALTDSVDLQGYKYTRYVQRKESVEIEGTALRLWVSTSSGAVIQAEAHVVDPSALRTKPTEALNANTANDQAILATARAKTLRLAGDAPGKALSLERVWASGRLVRRVEARTALGVFRYDFDAQGGAVVSAKHRAPQLEDAPAVRSSSPVSPFASEPVLAPVPVQVYKLWEYAYGDFSTDPNPANHLQALSEMPLRNLLARYRTIPFGTSLDARSRVYSPNELTPEVRSRFTPFWNADGRYLSNGGVEGARVRLIGRNAAVFVSPEGGRAFTAPWLAPFSPAPHFDSTSFPRGSASGVAFFQPFWGRAATSTSPFSARRPFTNGTPASGLDPRALLAEGFDDLQVYTGIDTFMETLRESGFGDPDISTRPFAAFLYEPSVEMRDNAYNDGDTIHFSTYSLLNMARDNTTIWHELGHGIQARVMGPHIDAESYGLWEGMADFIASLVVARQYGLAPFPGRQELRIANRTWFNNTNEEHDEGEAYGGAMEDMLQSMMRQFGEREGQLRMADLTFETMRLTRDHPALTPTVWFNHMEFADSLERDGKGFSRRPGELMEIVRNALRARDYMPGAKPASVSLTYKGNTVSNTQDLGGRYNPVVVPFDSLTAPQSFAVSLSASNGDAGTSGFQFPLRVRVDFNVWALQGALRWQENEEPLEYTLEKEGDVLPLPLVVRPGCDASNRSDGGCSDYAYVRAWNAGDASDARPIVKKRFYVRLTK